jgi:hypothetical protein
LLSHSSGPSSFRSSSDDWVQSIVRYTCVRARSTIRASERPNTLAPLRDARGCGARERVPLLVSFIWRVFQRRAPARFHQPEAERGRPAGSRLPPVHPAVDEATRKRSRRSGAARGTRYGDRRSLAVGATPRNIRSLGFAYVSAPRSARLAHDVQIRSVKPSTGNHLETINYCVGQLAIRNLMTQMKCMRKHSTYAGFLFCSAGFIRCSCLPVCVICNDAATSSCPPP